MELNETPLTKTSFVPHDGIITVGNLKFRFNYAHNLIDEMKVSGSMCVYTVTSITAFLCAGYVSSIIQ